MKIHQIIREKRSALGLTQEQIADYLGVSTPAVNKWEKGSSYPDITLLPPLARLLGIDLNTLLSFEEELSDSELALFVNEVANSLATEGHAVGYEKAMNYIHKYPTCHKLILNLAIVLQGGLCMHAPNEIETYSTNLEQLYERCLDSDNVDIKYQTILMLVTTYINKQQFDKAQEFLDRMPNIQFDKQQQQGLLYIMQEDFERAAKLYESELVSAANKITSILLAMVEIAVKENRKEDAAYFSEMAAKNTALFDLWDYITYANYFQLYCAQKDAKNCVAVLTKMLPALEKPWDFSQSKLYAHLDAKSMSVAAHQQMVGSIIKMLKTNPMGELDFLMEHPEFKLLMQKYTLEGEGAGGLG